MKITNHAPNRHERWGDLWANSVTFMTNPNKHCATLQKKSRAFDRRSRLAPNNNFCRFFLFFSFFDLII
jgi:hypothetical protein